MSFYDTIRCIWHDPAFLVRTHADTLATAVFFVVIGLLVAVL